MKRAVVVVVVVAVAMTVSACAPKTPVSEAEAEVAGAALGEVVEFLLANGDLIISVASLLVLWVFDRDLGSAKTIAAQLMLRMEKLAREELEAKGEEKMERVVRRVLDALPNRLKALLGAYAGVRGMTLEDLVEDLAQTWYDEAIN
jgi:hypothetical protein